MQRSLKTLIALLVLILAWYCASGRWGLPASRVAAKQKVDFKRDIRPIFERSCYSCHGPQQALGQLRLDVRNRAMAGGISGKVIVSGQSSASRLIDRLLGKGSEVRMPLGGELPPADIALIRSWIDEGAVWPEELSSVEASTPRHWAYLKPVTPQIPQVNSRWIRNPIDSFVLHRLEKEGLSPSPEAERGKLLRRVYLDLIGLPPTVLELDSFLSDERPDAYERVVDRLLASEHFGERWARPWLDLARYADSNGFEKDNPRVMWKYRDWVIWAFNRDVPFDRFTVEQIAGDMLPGATEDQRIATGFHRNTMLNQEGGIDPEEARFETILDRVNTTATVWLGSTLACAQCHNHKYDPFSQKDYYKFLAFFEGAEYRTEGEGSERSVVEPELALATPEQEKKRLEITGEQKRLAEVLKTQTPALDKAQAVWEGEWRELDRKWKALPVISARALGGSILIREKDASVRAQGPNPENETYVVRALLEPGTIPGIRIEALVDARLPKHGPGRDPYGNFLLTGLEASVSPRPLPSKSQAISFKDASVDDSAVRFDAKRFLEVRAVNAAVDSPTGWYINATRDPVRFHRQAVFTPSQPLVLKSVSVLTVRLKFQAGSLGQSLGRFRLSVGSESDPLKITTLPARLRPALEKEIAARSKKESEDVAAQFRTMTPLLKAERDRLRNLNQELTNLGIIKALVMSERVGNEPPSTYFRERGSFLSRGERVAAAVPTVLPPIPNGQPSNRLGLAAWLVSDENPLTARVTVNRVWEQIWGRGLVETAEDFGVQGARPSHPELLDWLATEFIREKWSFKALARGIVTSSAYRQSSVTNRRLEERDPANRLLARGPRFRIEAEMVRDLALSVSGLLSRKVGGPSVYPLQPDGIWRNPYSSARWVTSPGEDRYRRSLYTFIRRTSPYPSLMTFDATSRETCTVRRVRTNTPLQALTVLNDEAFFELARGLAQRMIREGGSGVRQRLEFGFRVCSSRPAKAMEVERLERMFVAHRERFISQPEAAAKVARRDVSTQTRGELAELAAMTMVANVLLNLDETLNKE